MSNLIFFLKKNGIILKKKFSQNFLIDKNILNKIIKTAEIDREDIVLEIGAGAGVLTKELALKAKKVIAIEKDKRFINHLKKINSNVLVLEKDFLKLSLDEILNKNEKVKVISNLPYNIFSLIISKLLKHYYFFSNLTLMMQYEVAKRILAKPSTKTYSSFTLFVNFYTDICSFFKISPNAFFPKPKVYSSLVHLKIRQNLPEIEKEQFHLFVKNAFQQRRKKLLNSLRKKIPIETLKKVFFKLNLDENIRAENLTLEEFIKLFNNLF
ncbi:MAG: hypothetical protein AMS24_04040 [Chlamydiae bacterium SM23_39]|nr:MAG: hypothetical protein AMS24_04040 [Chlamydiae bacterium SM23_39]